MCLCPVMMLSLGKSKSFNIHSGASSSCRCLERGKKNTTKLIVCFFCFFFFFWFTKINTDTWKNQDIKSRRIKVRHHSRFVYSEVASVFMPCTWSTYILTMLFYNFPALLLTNNNIMGDFSCQLDINIVFICKIFHRWYVVVGVAKSCPTLQAHGL